MINFLSIIAVGFFLGMRHATDPDHVIAVTTIVTGNRKLSRAALIGAFWGIGHTLTIFVVGSGIILFDLVIPARIGLSMELSVGVMLIVLGVMNVAGFWRSMPVVPAHTHDDVEARYPNIHAHPHTHAPHSDRPDHTPLAWLDRTFGRIGFYQYLRPLIIGIVHGLAGSAAVALLVLTTIRNSNWAIAYLLVFGVGTIAGMMLITTSIASTLKLVGTKRQTFSRQLGMASGLLSLGFGLLVAYHICVVNGLFTSNPRWTPQ